MHLAPPVLVLHLKRFQHDGRTGRLTKLDTPVRFPFELDLSPFMAPAPAAGSASLKQQQKQSSQQQQQQQSSQQQQQPPPLYDLVGVVVHMGTMRGGHYVAYVKRAAAANAANGGANGAGSSSSASNGSGAAAPAGQWWYASDASVKPVSESEVANTQAYLLAYVRRGVGGDVAGGAENE